MGYVDYSRSVNSAKSIANFEVPLSHFKRALIDNYLNHRAELDGFCTEDIKQLKTYSVKAWKLAAKEVTPSSWHHTSKHYNKTDHYRLEEAAQDLLANGSRTEQFKPYFVETELFADTHSVAFYFHHGKTYIKYWLEGDTVKTKTFNFTPELYGHRLKEHHQAEAARLLEKLNKAEGKQRAYTSYKRY